MTPFQRLIKRTVDVVGAGAGLVLLSPLFALIAIAVKAESPGTVFYIDERLGLGGRRFRVVKFRSMRAGSPPRFNPDGSMLVEASDPRVTRVGRILRLGFDELPQLWNVLVGDMSIVGPRPDPVWALEKYAAGDEVRMQVRPGITGLAQVLGRTSIPWKDRLAIDRRYIAEYSLGLDLRVMFLTVFELIPPLRALRRGSGRSTDAPLP
jgi:lipopolysaccharide/colanic/teichoic acid biosynthesis glycosyltransferase